MGVSKDKAAYFPHSSDVHFWADSDHVETLIFL